MSRSDRGESARSAEQTLHGRLREASRERPVRLGRYDVTGLLGGGGMGTVYEARDPERDAQVALKTLLVADGTGATQLKREFRAVADLAHPNLAAVYELACEDGLWFFAMEHVDGLDFRRWARGEASLASTTQPADDRHERPTVAEARAVPSLAGSGAGADLFEIEGTPAPTLPSCGVTALREAFVDLTRGLLALHGAGLWHGDVKPGNVLVRRGGGVVLVDFGLARPVGERRWGTISGTPAYMAPEQLTGGDVGPASDWYGVGVMLYELLTGRLPFGDGSSHVELYIRKTLQTPPAPAQLLPDVDPELSEVCMWLLRPEPELRPDGRELLGILVGDRAGSRAGHAGRGRAAFVGRTHELTVLARAFDRAQRGARAVAHVHGPSGIGKSSIVRMFLDAARDVHGADIFAGRCYERESIPYKAFDGIIDQLAERLLAPTHPGGGTLDVEAILPTWTGELLEVFPALGTVPAIAARAHHEPLRDARELRRRAWTALAELFGSLSRATRRPVVLAIDDVQWADSDSSRLLTWLVQTASKSSLLLVASFRRVEAHANPVLAPYFELGRVLGERGELFDVATDALSIGDGTRLARIALDALGVTASAEQTAAIASEAHGVPFLIEELARFVAAGGVGARDASLGDALAARVRSLPVPQRALVDTIAVADSPVAQAVAFAAAGLDANALPALLAARSASLVRWTGAGADDRVSNYHDRVREAVLRLLTPEARRARHLALARALVARYGASGTEHTHGSWMFDAARHFSAAEPLLVEPADRLEAARLHAAAGRAARSTAAFPLAFECFTRGVALLPDAERAWEDHYDLALALHTGAAETAYLCADWRALTEHTAAVRRHGRSVMDQLVAWEVSIDACAGRHEYTAAVDTAKEVLELLGVHLPVAPTDADVGAAFVRTLEALERVGPEALAAMRDVDDPEVAAAMRLQVRVSPAAYFASPRLLPILAANLITTSIERGLSSATPYALALFGIVLNTQGMFPVSHRWGQLAVSLIDRWEDRSLEAATRHVVYNLVCPWMVPLETILTPLREVFDIGRRTGDLEYASYAAHGYVHNAMYAGRPLGPLLEEAETLGAEMRALGQVNAVHVHAPFEQLLKCWLGRTPDPSKLDDATFREDDLLAQAALEGSRSGTFVLRVVMGLARYHFGSAREASACFEIARDYLDAGPSVWHVPILHQFAVLAGAAAWGELDEAARRTLRPRLEASLAALDALARHAPVNFAHRAELARGALARIDGDGQRAAACWAEALAGARRGGWSSDVALAHEIAARAASAPAARREGLAAARDAYGAWGATAKAEALARELPAP